VVATLSLLLGVPVIQLLDNVLALKESLDRFVASLGVKINLLHNLELST